MFVLWVTTVGAVGGGGCAGPGLHAGFDAPDPGARLHAVEDAAEDGDRSAVPNLVNMLDSDDPAARMLAIRALERLTGETLAYDYSASFLERRAGIARWKEWLRAKGLAPSPTPADGDAPLASPADPIDPQPEAPAHP